MTTTNGMSQERMGEIALMLVKKLVRTRNLSMDPNDFRRQIGGAAKEFGIPFEEAAQFAKIITTEAFNDLMQGISDK
ncbi:MAG: hypothetical protein WAZ40_03670 [Minisyncoccia bacterium]